MFVPKLSIGDLNTIVANSEYDNDALTWKVVVPTSIQKKHRVKLIPNSGYDEPNLDMSLSPSKKRQSMQQAKPTSSVISIEEE